MPILAEGGGEVVRADEDAVDAVDLGDRLDLVERAFGLDLHQQADLAACVLQIVFHAPIAAGATAAGDAANAAGRIARRLDGAAGLIRCLNERDEQGLRADVEKALDQHDVVPRRAHDRRRGAGLRGLQLRQHVRHLVGRMLGVEKEPVEARMGDDLGRDRAAQAAPQADLQVAPGDGMLEGVAWKVHGSRHRQMN